MRLLLVLLLAAGPAAAQTRAGAGASAPTPPAAAYHGVQALRHEMNLRLTVPSLSAGSAFFADAPASNWLFENRPERYTALVRAALDLRDLETTLGSFENPRLLREALLERSDSEIALHPARLMSLAERTPRLKEKLEIIAVALLDWSVIGPNTRASLAERGVGETAWAGMRLSRRFSLIRSVMEERVADSITVPLGHPDYAAQYERTFEAIAPFMSNDEILGHQEALERAKRFAEGLRTAEASAAAGALSAKNLAEARAAGDIDRAEEILASVSPAEQPRGMKPVYDLDRREEHALIRRFAGALVASLAGTEVGAELLEGARSMPVEVEFAALGRGVGAHYSRRGRAGAVVVNASLLAELTAELGTTPRSLLTDDEALADVVVLYGHLMAHELTHHRQRQRKQLLEDALSETMYNRDDEREANNAEAAFLRQKRETDPDFAAREARILAGGGLAAYTLRQPEANAGSRAEMNRWLEGGYARLQTVERAVLRLMDAGSREQARMAPKVAAIELELARRRKLSSAERILLERQGADGGAAPVSRVKTSVLRRARAYWTETALRMMSEAWRIAEETRSEIDRLAR